MLIALGVTGGIGAYKAVEVARGLQKRGHDVAAIMTRSARRFVGELTFEAITRHPVITDQFARGANADIEHIALATGIGLLVIAPATANIIGKLANGIADDFLTSLYLATRAPVLLAPAMNTQMLEHPAVQRNMQTLTARGVQFVDPGDGFLACGWIGKGRLAEPDAIVEAAERLLRPSGSLLGRRIVVSAGPTYEDLDPVRYLGNRSSGRMGYAIAGEASRRGAHVVLVSGPTKLEAPAGVQLERVRSAIEMSRAMTHQAADADAVIMAAAVADYRPIERVTTKLKKKDLGSEMTIRMTENPDLLRAIVGSRRAGTVIVGFKAETGDAIAEASRMLRDKKLDLVVANDVTDPGSGFGSDDDQVAFVSADGVEQLPLLKKTEVARRLVTKLVERLAR